MKPLCIVVACALCVVGCLGTSTSGFTSLDELALQGPEESHVPLQSVVDSLLAAGISGSPVVGLAQAAQPASHHPEQSTVRSHMPEHRGQADAIPQSRVWSALPSSTALPGSVTRGIAIFALSPSVLGLQSTLDELKEMHALGVEFVAVSIALGMENVTSNTVYATHLTATNASLTTFLQQAAALGLQTMVKPVIIPGGGSMYQVKPTNPDEWFASMLPWLLQYAQLSAANNVDMLCIGVEFLHMTGAAYTTRWLAIAAAVRQVFSGQLTYSSLFVREWYTIEWWSAMDVIGIDAYFPLSNTSNPLPTPSQMDTAWKKWMGKIATWRSSSGLQDQPVMFTEVGYGSWTGVAAAPPTSPPTDCAGFETNFQTQAQCYQALFRAVAANADMVQYVNVFWFDNESTPDFYVNTTKHGEGWPCWFTPRGKTAYLALQTAFADP